LTGFQAEGRQKKSVMESKVTKLWNRDFSLVIIGQIISIFGNMVLSFALPLFILDISGSPALFGLVLGLPYISLLIMSPIGGILADRLRKQRIMFWLDVATTIIIVLYMIVSGFVSAVVPLVIVKLLALNAIQGMYIPAVQASIPLLVPGNKLTFGNAAASIVNSISAMAGMAIAGLLYGRFGLFPILVISAGCFAMTAVMDAFIRIPFKKQDASGGIAHIIKSDISLSVRFSIKEKPILAKGAVVIFLIILQLSSILIVGLPVLITEHLGFGMEFVGINQSIMMVGGLAGGIVAGMMGMKLTVTRALLFLTAGSLFIAPIGLVFLIDTAVMTSYIILTVSGALVFFGVQLFNVAAITFVQQETPTELVGKVMSVILVLPFLAQALGQMLYGTLFESFAAMPWAIIFITSALSAIISYYSYAYFRKKMTQSRTSALTRQ